MKSQVFAVLVAVGVAGSLGACRSQESKGRPGAGSATHGRPCSVPGTKGPCVTVLVTSGGEIELNGQPADLARVSEAFRDLAQERGVVLYSRDAAQNEPHPTALKVMELIVEHRLPVSMSTKRDFSDVVGADGEARPREPQ